PAEVCGCSKYPASARSDMTLRMVAELRPSDVRRARVREPTGSPVEMYWSTIEVRISRSRSPRWKFCTIRELIWRRSLPLNALDARAYTKILELQRIVRQVSWSVKNSERDRKRNAYKVFTNDTMRHSVPQWLRHWMCTKLAGGAALICSIRAAT